MAFVCGWSKLVGEICEALGLKNVRSLKINASMDEAVSVECEYFLESCELDKVVKVFQEHKDEFVLKPELQMLTKEDEQKILALVVRCPGKLSTHACVNIRDGVRDALSGTLPNVPVLVLQDGMSLEVAKVNCNGLVDVTTLDDEFRRFTYTK